MKGIKKLMSCQVVTRQNALKVDKFGGYFESWVAQKIKIKNLKKTSSIEIPKFHFFHILEHYLYHNANTAMYLQHS